jgi:hypothetical protein
MILTFKAIARSAGYVAGQYGESKWSWRDTYGVASSGGKFDTEAEAYYDCCRKAGLVVLDGTGHPR